MTERISLTNLDEEQLIALMTSALVISEQTGLPPEEVVRSIKELADKKLLSVVQRRAAGGRLEVGFHLHHMDGADK